MTQLSQTFPRTMHYTPILHSKSKELLDHGLVVKFRSPKSFTGEDLVEFHSHGSKAVIRSILSSLSEMGFRPASPGEFTMRAFHNGKLNLLQAEALGDLIHAETAVQQRLALKSDYTEIEKLRERLVDLSCLVEAFIDFDSEEQLDVDISTGIKKEILSLIDLLTRMRNLGTRVKSLKEGALVVISGEPNVGKSTLLNALTSKDLAIVSPIPGTTRDVLEHFVDLGGYPVRLCDTAGLRSHSTDRLELIGIERAKKKVKEAFLVLRLLDAHDCIKDLHTLADLKDSSDSILIFNKCDLLSSIELQSLKENSKNSVFISAKNSSNLEALVDIIKTKLSLSFDSLDTEIFNQRQIQCIADCLRELEEAAGHTDVALCAENVRRAVQRVGELTGKVYSEHILDRIFSRFCIGK